METITVGWEKKDDGYSGDGWWEVIGIASRRKPYETFVVVQSLSHAPFFCDPIAYEPASLLCPWDFGKILE